MGFEAIEWVFEAERWRENPIRHEEGRQLIQQRMATTGVRVLSVCADYFMAHPFVRVSPSAQARSVAVLLELIRQAHAIGASTILLPVLETSEIRTAAECGDLIACLREPLALARSLAVRIGLETELPARDYVDLVERIGEASAAVYYDVGNAAAKGYDVAADLRWIRHRLCGVHVKDRLRGGRSVPLGQGVVDFPACVEALAGIGYDGLLVLQTAFGDDYLRDAAANLRFVRHVFSRMGEGKAAGVQSR
jgi:hexulose-6-phosphate isomerase